MDSLRLTLLITGIAFVVAIYLFEKFRRSRSDKRYGRWGGSEDNDFVPRASNNKAIPADSADYGDVPDDLEEDYEEEPVVSKEETLRDITDELQQLEGIIATREDEIEQFEIDGLEGSETASVKDEPGQPDEVIIVNVFATDGRVLSGPDILAAALEQDIKFGEMGFFHRFDEDQQVAFSMANALQPGSFDIGDMESLATRGLVFFMSLPGNGDPLSNFDAMLSSARDIATTLHAQLHDETRSVLTRQGIEAIRTRLSEYKLKNMQEAESA